MYCVYKHVNKHNNKVYVGMTNDPKRRWRQGGVEYKPDGRQKESPFYNAILKYGFDSFDHVILEDGLTFDEACQAEIKYIKELEATDKRKGYNVSPGGNGGRVYLEHPRNMLGRPQTEYQKEHQRLFMLDKKNNPMKNGSVIWGVTHDHPRGFKGKKKSPEERARISRSVKEKKVNCIPIKAIFPDGTEIQFESVKAAEQVGLTKPVILKLLRSGAPFEIKVVNQYSEKNKHLVGLRFEYVEKIPR